MLLVQFHKFRVVFAPLCTWAVCCDFWSFRRHGVQDSCAFEMLVLGFWAWPLFSDLSKWERVSKMKFKHENVRLVPYPYICTLYLELNSFQRNIPCGKSLWLCLGDFWKHLWSVSCFSLFLHLLSLNQRGKLHVGWLYCEFETVHNRVFFIVSYCFSKILWIPLSFSGLSNHCWLFSWYFYEAMPNGSQPSLFNLSHWTGASTYMYMRHGFFLVLDYICWQTTSYSLLLFS